eukprot:TRINITY_DN39105_c0_g1_i1.p1 TRINITY_DN39105_c0_g1~~TRINITY_DN39105_c0_g1_i1.p1  ORF type:complete len:196 (+),score=42.54 TRINITY_DN39105_c0_g1_i1:97-684(+)
MPAQRPQQDRRSRRLLGVDAEKEKAARQKPKASHAARAAYGRKRLDVLETDRCLMSSGVKNPWDASDSDDAGSDFEEQGPGSRRSSTAKGSSTRGSSRAQRAAKKQKFKRRSLEDLMTEELDAREAGLREVEQGFFEAAMVPLPPRLPARRLCAVCLRFGRYTCSGCSRHLCSLACFPVHKEASLCAGATAQSAS